MAISATLRPGIVSIYGYGTGSASINGFVPPTRFLFGVVDQIWGSASDMVEIGQSVMYNSDDIIAIITSSNWPYTLIPENKIILIETVAP